MAQRHAARQLTKSVIVFNCVVRQKVMQWTYKEDSVKGIDVKHNVGAVVSDGKEAFLLNIIKNVRLSTRGKTMLTNGIT